VLGSALRDNLKIECAGGGGAHAGAHAGEDDLMNVRKLNKAGLLGDKENVFFEQKEVALDGFQVSFDARMAIPAGQYN